MGASVSREATDQSKFALALLVPSPTVIVGVYVPVLPALAVMVPVINPVELLRLKPVGKLLPLQVRVAPPVESVALAWKLTTCPSTFSWSATGVSVIGEPTPQAKVSARLEVPSPAVTVTV